ncbi:type I glyceraldehyde-3-phosphate dehydrogenase [Helicobacter kayseriensis]|uniref:type I glyceraldehyde-3-phosphate dehydrogenase n=1 Tax=Helicobacter kayseriensis TaxID=2905877 RepID=UPI001E4B74E8|nr:type I glyceraldehyde-3-phosphate dehydrogenase [Helicobacter kayseriensis]MCE3046532.1 type I glyceraldehyde-3-phosphate dehydrogenase [Helicobacter kayseriensis]MCE3048165.1 type I glyceraldehyde-3-phosphate dehydrogenase [Helicobacter kayseriensis]
MVKVGINGSGRIGLCTARIISTREDIELGAINTTTDIDTLIHLLRYDSVHRYFEVEKVDDHTIAMGHSKNIKILSSRNPQEIGFEKYGIQGVIECTGAFNSYEKSLAHLHHDIQKVIISAPADQTPTFVYGVNHLDYKGESIISNASCTTNCLAPIVKVLDEKFGIIDGLMTTIHSYTNDQNLLDVKHKDLRRARAAALNMIPTSTGAAKAIGLVLPHLQGKLNGFAIRVPTPDVSLVDLSINLAKETTAQEINETFLQAKQESMCGILDVDLEKRVSSDFIGTTFSSIIVADKTVMTTSTHAKILAWYDNEMGYCHRLVDMSVFALTH